MSKKKTIELNPKSDLGKMLLALMYGVAAHEPMAFAKVNVEKAIQQADAAAADAPGPQREEPTP